MSDEKRPLDQSGQRRQSPPLPPRNSLQLPPPLSPTNSARDISPPAYSPLPSIDSVPVGPLVRPDAYGRVSMESEERRPSGRNSRRAGDDDLAGSWGPGELPPPPYTEHYGLLDITHDGMETKAKIADDGRVNISINQNGRVGNLLARSQLSFSQKAMESRAREPATPLQKDLLEIPEFAKNVPKLNILIQIIGSRGDVQPFIALGIVLKQEYGHRVRVATHPTFKGFVEENGLEFFSLGGDPSELMAFMVKNPGLMPGLDSLTSGDVGKRRQAMWDVLLGGWKACIQAGDGLSYAPAPGSKQFVADAIIANPPSYGHIHCAEKLGVPLHIMFTMPWSPTTAFPHPLANIQSSNAENSITNSLSYALVEMLTWQGLGDLVNRFREKTLGLEPLSSMWAPGMISRLRVPHTYCWSPTLIPKPNDWPEQISISGFYFLSLASSYTPPQELIDFLESGPPPVYIGFGSIVVDDPNALTEMIFDAIRISGIRALVSKGWGGLGGEEFNIPEGVMMLGNCPHDWLFPRCAAVVHHGGAGTTAAGVRCGKPTIIVPFFGDQQFWGNMIARAGAGPEPIAYKNLTAQDLAASITDALTPRTLERAKELGERIRDERGTEEGAKKFLARLAQEPGEGGISTCDLTENRVAVWKVRKSNIKLSALAACVLVEKEQITGGWDGLKLYHHKNWNVDEGPWEPISGATSALLGTVSSIMMGVGDLPREVFRSFKKSSEEGTSEQNSLYPINSRNNSRATSTTSLSNAQSPPETPLATNPQASSSSAPIRGKTERSATSESSPQQGAGSGVSLAMAAGTGRGVSRIVGAGLKSPMDFTLSLAQGFHNAPRLYGDDTVRPVDKVTGFQSGLKAAGKGFGYGFYDGISGLVTQPMKGAKEEGAAGFLKGVGKGLGGIVLKGGAAVWGLPGYTMKGIHKEIQKIQTSDSTKQIIDSRKSQGQDECRLATLTEKDAILSGWSDLMYERARQPKKRESVSSISSKWRSRRHPSSPPPVEGESSKSPFIETTRALGVTSPVSPDGYTPTTKTNPSNTKMLRGLSDHGDDEFEFAIQKSVQTTSRGDPKEDEMIERAIRASVAEIQNASQTCQNYDDEELMRRAIQASIDEVGKYGTQTSGLEQSLRSSLRERSTGVSQATTAPMYDNHYADEDEEFQRAVRESQRMTQPPPLPPPYHDPDEQLERALRESRRESKAPVRRNLEEMDEDEELRTVLEESRRVEEERETKKRIEEEVVMQYVKKASLEEIEYLRRLEEQKDIERAMRASMNRRQWGSGSSS